MNRCCALSLILLGTMVCFLVSAAEVRGEPPAHSGDDLLRENVVAIQATVRDMEQPFLDEKSVQDSFAEAAEWKTNFAKVQHLTDSILFEKRVGHNVGEFVFTLFAAVYALQESTDSMTHTADAGREVAHIKRHTILVKSVTMLIEENRKLYKSALIEIEELRVKAAACSGR